MGSSQSAFLRAAAIICFTTLVLASTAAYAAQPGMFYTKAGLGGSFSRDTAFADKDCQSISPAALFGCGPGNDGSSLGADGDFGNSILVEFGGGYQAYQWLRAEILLAYRPDFSFSGSSNFRQINPSYKQRVTGDASSFSGSFNVIFDVASVMGLSKQKLHPLLLGGIGFSHNRTESMNYHFPTTVTQTPSGSTTEFSWNVGAGVAYDYTESISFECIYRYSDLGTIQTDADTMVITSRSDNSIISDSIVIGKTHADFTAHELLFSVIWYF
jgi:opacity protein-like surface antigen